MTLSLLNKKWEERPKDERLALTFSQRYGLSDMAARLLAGRGLTLETIEGFIRPSLKSLLPDPLILKDMDKAVQATHDALKSRKKIAVFGDYDVDGATSSALLKRYFRALGYDIEVYIPDRMTEGYGPNKAALDKLKSMGTDLVITVDCGTTSYDALEHAKAIGLDVIVLDHHGAEVKLPECVALVNPNRLDESDAAESLRHVAAVGMCFLFTVALNRHMRNEGFFADKQEPDLMSFLDMVALGTVCDVMPLKGLNRAFVKQGLKVMARRGNLGLTTLADGAGIDEAPSAYHLGFLLGPRINAGGRVGESSLGSRLLSSEDSAVCKEIAARLHQLNDERKAIEADVLAEAMQQAESQRDEPCVVVSSGGWHEGVIGIVAGRIKDAFHKPTCVISWNEEGIGKASARSIPGVDLGSIIRNAVHLGLLAAGGGHAMAAGFSLEKHSEEKFKDYLSAQTSQAARELDLTPTVKVDGVLSLGAIHLQMLRELEELGPYGMGHSTPKFIVENVTVDHARLVGTDHISCQLRDSTGARGKGIAFRHADTDLGHALLSGNKYPLSLLVSIKYNVWNGVEEAQIIIEDGHKSLKYNRQIS